MSLSLATQQRIDRLVESHRVHEAELRAAILAEVDARIDARLAEFAEITSRRGTCAP